MTENEMYGTIILMLVGALYLREEINNWKTNRNILEELKEIRKLLSNKEEK